MSYCEMVGLPFEAVGFCGLPAYTNPACANPSVPNPVGWFEAFASPQAVPPEPVERTPGCPGPFGLGVAPATEAAPNTAAADRAMTREARLSALLRMTPPFRGALGVLR